MCKWFIGGEECDDRESMMVGVIVCLPQGVWL